MSNLTEQYCNQIETALKHYLPQTGGLQERLVQSMTYSLLDGGKRIRPILVLEFNRLCGGSQEAAMPFACAVEMVHTYSLIHDDLPCMDNDDMRRGKPSNHKLYGEDMALLAGDALQALAFEVMLSEESIAKAGAHRAASAAGILGKAIGAEGTKIPLETLRKMDEGKTGALISACVQMGCVLGGGSEKELQAAREYADAIGLAFQIVDDILDIEGDTATLGKQVGSDVANDKSTYVSILGMQQAKVLVQQLTQTAVHALESFQGDTQYLKELAEYLAYRKK